MASLLPLIAAAALLHGLAGPAHAQDPTLSTSGGAPAHLAYAEGPVDVVRDGLAERAAPPLMLFDGDSLRTRGGRAELVFSDGTLVHVAPDSDVELLGDAHLRLLSGRLIMRLSAEAVRPYVVDAPAGSVRLEAEGEYAIDVQRGETLEVAVARGEARLADAAASTVVRGGMLARLGAAGRLQIEPYNSARWDGFARWAHERARSTVATHSASRLPSSLRPYSSVLDHHGAWEYLSPHGYVWRPHVSVGWRPYHDGWWSFTRYGWTWYGADPFAWPTHHYGRWGFTGVYWYWIPAVRWAPAWVGWVTVPGYVGWAPLGWDGRPVRVLGRPDHPAYRPYYDAGPSRVWTLVPRDHFAPRRNARRHAVDVDRLDPTTRRAVIGQQAVAVPGASVAVPRGTAAAGGAREAFPREMPAPAIGAGAVRRLPAGRRHADDDPAFAPPSSWTDRGDRPGRVRRLPSSPPERGSSPPQRVEAPPAPSSRRPDASAGAVRRAAPRPDPPEASRGPARPARGDAAPRGAAGGAVERRGSDRRPSAAQPPSAPPPSAEAPRGGARRRPPIER